MLLLTERGISFRSREATWHVVYNDTNLGFAAGQNQAMRLAHGEWLLCLNPDVVLSADFISRLVEVGSSHRDAGSVCGKLLRWNPAASEPRTQVSIRRESTSPAI